ncbi:hypothetical protein HPB52_018241 [Rhipicephalus sanguineus]|uniref:Cadherin domain-containing protein n=1 Tax=Rhipicephalus sanguineus TaxID=34632 RepID=A0A9D4YQJ1_RHISA|nr:hypothetical protein HPB52_018241 [Rhipicephalus sanguineus]
MAHPPRLICAVVVLVALWVPSHSKTSSDKVLVLPDDVYPGLSVKQLPYLGQSFSLTGEPRVARCFSMLSDGLLMVATNVSHLVGKPGKLVVTETDFPSWPRTHRDRVQELLVHVIPKQQLLKFPKSELRGAVLENECAGTTVLELDGATRDASRDVKYELVPDEDGSHEDFSVSRLYANSTRLALRTSRPLDREHRRRYELNLRASDDVDSALTRLMVDVLDVNDNDPVADREAYVFRVSRDSEPYTIVGNVSASDADGDSVSFRLAQRHPFFTVVPKTGELMVTRGLEPKSYLMALRVGDRGKPQRFGRTVAVKVEVFEPEPAPPAQRSLETQQTRVRRSTVTIRPTKTYRFEETKGRDVNKTVFTLDKKAVDETFELEKPDRWVYVSPNGDVRVKEKWDYEQLDKEKSIDFWVLARSPGRAGQSSPYLCSLPIKT